MAFNEISVIIPLRTSNCRGIKSKKVVPYTDALEILEKHPNITLFTTQHLGHSLYSDDVNEQIVYFLENNHFKL